METQGCPEGVTMGHKQDVQLASPFSMTSGRSPDTCLPWPGILLEPHEPVSHNCPSGGARCPKCPRPRITSSNLCQYL